MDIKLLQAYEHGDDEKLSAILGNLTIDEMLEMVDDDILRHQTQREPTLLLRSVFKGCRSKKQHLSSHALASFLHCMKLLVSPDVPQNIGTDIIGILLHEVDHLSAGGLVDTSKLIIEMIRKGNTGHGRALQVLPKVLSCLEQQPEVHLGLGQGAMPGFEYKKHFINSVCSGKWSGKSIIHLANVFKDVPMSSDEMGFFLRKMLRQLGCVEVQEIPPLIHQMLPLAGRTHHETMLRGIFLTFSELLEKTRNAKKGEDWEEMFEIEEDNGDPRAAGAESLSKDLKMVEGTVLLHLTNMARWDQCMGKVFLKMLKLVKDSLSEGSISSLSLAFALSLAQTKIFREPVLDVLKGIVFRCFSHHHREVRSNWLKQRSVSVPDIEKLLEDVLESCKHGWDQVISGIVYLAFCLMDSYGPKSGAFGRPLEGDPVKEDTPSQKCCDLGAYLLANVFKSHPATRTEIIEQILNRVIMKTTSVINHYIDILRGICKRYPSTLLESKHKIREFFDHICLLSPQNADCVLRSMLPLIRINSHLKDSLILVLRKALFSCNVNGRVIACNGFLLLLQNFKVSGYVSLSQASSQSSQSIFSISSQIHVDVHSSAAGPSSSQTTNYEPLCLEVLSTLRRCLTQQSVVRGSLYQGLWNVIANNPHLTGPILEKLLQHFGRYYEEQEGVLPPIKTDVCVGIINGEPSLIEPLSTLMSTIFLSWKKGQDLQKSGGMDEDEILDDVVVESMHKMFTSISNRMSKCEMEDFELDKSAEFSNNTSVGKKNCILGNLVLGCYQSMIEYSFMQDDWSEDTANKILRLYSCYKKFKDAILGGKKEGNKSWQACQASPVVVKELIESLFCDGSPDKEVGMNILRLDDEFVKYAIDIAHNCVSHARDHGFMKGIGGGDKSVVLETCMSVGRCCLVKFWQVKNDMTTSAIAFSCLEVFHCALQYIISRKKKRLEEFLTSASLDDITLSRGNVQDKHIKRFQRLTISYLSEDVDLSSSHKKVIPLLISILDTLSSTSCEEIPNAPEKPHLSSTPYPAGITQMNEWVGKLCSEQVIDDAPITKSLLSLHLRLSLACGPWTGMDRAAQGSEGAVRDMAKDIHIVAGDIEPDEEESRMLDERRRGEHYKIIDECNVINIVPLIVSNIDSAIDETDWLLQRVKGEVASILADDKFKDSQNDAEVETENNFHNKRRKIESAMCTRLGNLLIAYRELLESDIPLGSPAESIFRGLAKLFVLLTSFTKYYTWLVTQGVTKSPSPRFEKLVKLTGTEVTRYVYPFISHIESKQSERNKHAAKKRKRKEEKSLEKQKVLRETKSIPPLIYAIENMERFLITLGKKCKIDLLSGHKLPTSRDFRIKSSILKEAFARREDTQETQESTTTTEADPQSDSETENNEPNVSKRARSDQ